MIKIIGAFIAIASFLINAVVAQEPVDAAVNAKIRDEGLDRSQVLKTFEHFTEAIGPRLTGSPAAKAADDYAVQTSSNGVSLTLTSNRGNSVEAGSLKSRRSN